jgi:hypothetical protein
MPLGLVLIFVGWISAGMREHEDEFRQAWIQRFGMNASGPTPPPATYKAWYKQWKKTGIGPSEWLDALRAGPPGATIV